MYEFSECAFLSHVLCLSTLNKRSQNRAGHKAFYLGIVSKPDNAYVRRDTLVELSVPIPAWKSVYYRCPCRIIPATTDICCKPRSYIRSTDIRTDIRLDMGVMNIRARSLHDIRGLCG